MNDRLKWALILLVFAVIVFLVNFRREEKERELVENVSSTIDFGGVT